MVRGSHGTRFTGSTLVRLLSRLSEVDVSESKPGFAERLSHWLGWTDAISLAAALDGRPPPGEALTSGTAEGEFTRVRSALTNAIERDFALPAKRQLRTAPVDTDFPSLRRRYTARQQAMETSIGSLRSRLRDAAAAASPALARLAAVDTVMEQVLGAQESALLSTVPNLLERHFDRVRKANEGDDWIHAFRQDMKAVLLAELDIRLQPIEGLLQALRTMPTTGRPHE